ncbi:MAG TPA: hypothetical protein VK636_13635 [Gemmatimonadaceae bacterium]|nr:hypothetical protein [Gemmatimonadaceae bacterium]
MTPDELRLQSVRLRAEKLRADERRAAEGRVLSNLDRMVLPARDFRDSQAERQAHEAGMADLAEEDPRVADRGAGETVRAMILGPVALITIGCIDLCLLGAASQFILSLIYSAGNAEQPLWTLFVVPPSVLAFELFVATCVAVTASEHDSLSLDQRRPLNPARAVAWILAVVVPCLAAATLLEALNAQQDHSPLVNALLIVAVVILAGCVHGAVLFFGNRGREAATFLINRGKYGRHQRRASAAGRASNRHRDRSRDGLRGYNAAIGAYRSTVGELPDHLSIAPHDAKLINDAIGAVVVRIPGEEDQGNGPAVDAPVQPAPTAPGATTSPPAREELSDELEYFRRAMRGRQADADGEIN